MCKNRPSRQRVSTPALALFAVVVFGWRVASAETFKFDGQTIVVNPPTGYCALDPQNASEKALIDQQKLVQSSYNEVPLVYGDCTQLDEWRSGKRAGLDNMGAFTVIKDNGKIVAYRGVPRQTFLDEVAKSMPALAADQIQDAINQKLAGSGSGQSIAVNSMALLKRDEFALYIGGIGVAAGPGADTAPKVAVNAMTLINSLPVALSIARPASAEITVDFVLAAQRDNIENLIQANAASEASASFASGFLARIDWHETFVAAVAGAAISLVGYFALRLTGRLRSRKEES